MIKCEKMAEVSAAPAAKRRKVDVEREQEGEVRKRLLESLKKLADSVNKVVDESRAEYTDAGTRTFVDAPPGAKKRGIKILWSHVASYVDCFRANGVQKYSELEEVWKQHYGCQEVREVVEELLEAEERHRTFLEEVEKEFVSAQDSRADLKTGDVISGGVELTDARSLDVRKLRSYWPKSKFTLFVLLRHFG